MLGWFLLLLVILLVPPAAGVAVVAVADLTARDVSAFYICMLHADWHMAVCI